MSSLDGAEEIEIQGSADDVIAYLASLDATVQLQTHTISGYLDPTVAALAAAGQIQIQTVTDYPDDGAAIQTVSGYPNGNGQVQVQALSGYLEPNLTGQIVTEEGYQQLDSSGEAQSVTQFPEGGQQVVTQILTEEAYQALQASGQVPPQRVETQILTEAGYRTIRAPGQIGSQVVSIPGSTQQIQAQIMTGDQPLQDSEQSEVQAVQEFPDSAQRVETQIMTEAGYEPLQASHQTDSSPVPSSEGTHHILTQSVSNYENQNQASISPAAGQINTQEAPGFPENSQHLQTQEGLRNEDLNPEPLETTEDQPESGYQPADSTGQLHHQTMLLNPEHGTTSLEETEQMQTKEVARYAEEVQTPHEAPGQIEAETAQGFPDATRQIDPQVISGNPDASRQMQGVSEYPGRNEPQTTRGAPESSGQDELQTMSVLHEATPGMSDLEPQAAVNDSVANSSPPDVSGRVKREGLLGDGTEAVASADAQGLLEEQDPLDDRASDEVQEQSEFQELTPPDEEMDATSQEEGPSHKYIILPRLTVKVTCGGCGKEAEIPKDSSSITESSYICEICKSRAQKKHRLHQLINGGTFVQEPQRAYEPKTKHPCQDCKKEFSSPKDLRRHTNIHMGLRPFKCETCGKAFSQSCGLKRHLLTHTDEKPHRCEVCGLTFKGHLARHMRTHTGELPFKCEICQKGFYRSELLKNHMSEHMTDGTVTVSKTKLEDILQKGQVKQEHTCLICDKTYTNGGHLTRHMKQHNNENVLRCGVCTKVFYVKQELQEHLQGHSKEDLAAIIAGTMASFPIMTNGSAQSTFNKPMGEDEPMEEDDSMDEDEQLPLKDIPLQTTTPVDVKPAEVPVAAPEEHACLQDRVTCGICGHACCCTNYIPRHMEDHEGAMTQCRSCGMDFIPMNAADNSQICTICKPEEGGIETKVIPADIAQPVGDLDHVVKEDGSTENDTNGRHECIECGKTYKFLRHLREHALMHGGEFRPYKCNVCGKGFSKRYHLNRHQLIHARGGKPRFGRRPDEMRARGRPSRLMEALTQPKRSIGRPRKHPLVPEAIPKQEPTVARPVLAKMKELLTQTEQNTTRSPQKHESKPVTPVKKYTYVRPPKSAGSLPFVCCACGKVFPKRVPLKRHLLDHLREGTIPRDHPQLEEMRVNSYVKASDTSPQLKHCPICGKACKGLHLHRHMKIHSEEELAKYYKEEGGALALEGLMETSPVGFMASSPEGRMAAPLERGVAVTPEKNREVERSSHRGQGKVIYKEDESPIEGDDSDFGMGGDEDGMMMIKEEVVEDPTPAEEIQPHECLDDKVTCGICGHSCCCANYITVHMETHNDEPDTCQKCGKELGDLPPTYHNGGRICSICTSRSRKQLRLHQILRNRVLPKEPVEVDDDGSSSGGEVVDRKRNKPFPEQKSLQAPVRTHGGGRRFQCGECGMEFNHSRNYKRHIWRHTGMKPNWCHICKKGIAGHLARHMRSHSDQKSYVCNMCHRGFNRSEHLKRHLKTHLGMQETYQCHLCPKKYLRKEHLKRHIRSHADGTEPIQFSHIKPNDPPVNEQPFREHPCTSSKAVCGLCGDVCCCSNYIPFHMEVHGEKPEDYIEGTTKPVAPIEEKQTAVQEMSVQDGDVKTVREHSCTYDPVTCGLCGHACCCANYIPLHMQEQHGYSTEDHIPNPAKGATKEMGVQERHEEPQTVDPSKDHACMRDSVTCGLCTEVCCCSATVPRHMQRHIKNRPAPATEDDILKKALDATAIGDDHIRPHPCLHEIVSCGVCGEPICCINYIRFHMELHSEELKQETNIQEGKVHDEIVANPDARTDQVGCDTGESAPVEVDKGGESEEMETQESEVVPEPVATSESDKGQGESGPDGVITQTVPLMGVGEGVINNGGSEEFDWASVATFLQGARDEEPAPASEVQPSTPSVTVLNGSPVKQEPTVISTDPAQIPSREEHVCLQAQVDCETCGITFCCINDLLPHLDTHNIQTVPCEVCHQDVSVTKTISVFKDGVKIYKCGTCMMGVSPTMSPRQPVPSMMSPGKVTSSATSPEQVMSTSPAKPTQVSWSEPSLGGSTPKDKSIPCPHCTRVLKSRKEYTRHIKIHAEVKPYKCDICDKEFATTTNLRRHLDAHAGVKRNECPICGQFFSGHLARHMRTHTGEKKYSCDVCQKAFLRLEHLKRHLGQHLKEGTTPAECKQLIDLGISEDTMRPADSSPTRLNWCNICNKTVQGRLARHMRAHSGIKPHECPECGKAFSRSEHLKRHLEIHKRKQMKLGGNQDLVDNFQPAGEVIAEST